jgi:hypothetical protein
MACAHPDVLRRCLVKSLPKADDQFVVLKQKAMQQHCGGVHSNRRSRRLGTEEAAAWEGESAIVPNAHAAV